MMNNRFFRSILALTTVIAASPVLFAQQEAAPSRPDLSGVWSWALKGDSGGRRRFNMEEPPLQPSAMEVYKVRRKGVKDLDGAGVDELDPVTYCFPPGATRAMLGSTSPFEIIQLPKRLVILDEMSNSSRQIFMDGRGHPDGWPFGWMGHSIAKWDGDTLVVDTVGFNEKTWLDLAGTPHSDALHVVERMRRLNGDTLQIDFRFEDPKTFTKPWEGKRLYRLKPDWDIVEKVVCEEYLQVGKYPQGQ